jgi:hypothetical protein
LEGGRRKVQISLGASSADISDGDGDILVVVCRISIRKPIDRWANMTNMWQ